MSIQLGSSGSFIPVENVQAIMPIIPKSADYQSNDTQKNKLSELNYPLTPERKNSLQKNIDDNLATQVDKITSNVKAAKDIDLMQSHYQQQQKLVDIYLQSVSESSTSISHNEQTNSALVAVTNGYTSLQDLYSKYKNRINDITTLPENTLVSINNLRKRGGIDDSDISMNNALTPLTRKQLETYQKVMISNNEPRLHLSA